MSREASPEAGHHSHDEQDNDNHNDASPPPQSKAPADNDDNDADKVQKLFIGNLPQEARRNQVVDLFKDLGDIISIGNLTLLPCSLLTTFEPDLKNGYAFVELDGDIHGAIRKLDQTEFEGRRIRVEMSLSASREQKQREKRDSRQNNPSRCLFVANFGPRITERMLDDLFSPFGRIARIAINLDRKNYAFIEYERLEDAQSALKALHKSPFQERELTVEFSDRDTAPRYLLVCHCVLHAHYVLGLADHRHQCLTEIEILATIVEEAEHLLEAEVATMIGEELEAEASNVFHFSPFSLVDCDLVISERRYGREDPYRRDYGRPRY
jgi:RNA recognition motif-containing protein